MKRYLLFAGYNYYPAPAMQDYRGAFDTRDAAREKAIDLLKAKPGNMGGLDWWQIVDHETMELIEDDEG